MLKILITGSNGFIGGSLGRHAARAGHTVLGVARASQPAAGWPGGYAQADVLSSDLSGVVREFAPDLVVHAAGTASVGASLQTPLDDLRAAVLTWANTLDGVRRSGLKTLVVFPSSAAVYGEQSVQPVGEESPSRPISPYGYHKTACELVAREYAECFGLRVAMCRLFSTFGPAQRRLLVWELYRQFAGPDHIVWLQGTGAEVRDYLHADDVSSALLGLAERLLGEPEGARHIVVNVASGEETSVLELAGRMRALVAPHKEVRCRNVERAGDPRTWRADTERLRSLVPGWQPQPLPDALARCVAAWGKEEASDS